MSSNDSGVQQAVCTTNTVTRLGPDVERRPCSIMDALEAPPSPILTPTLITGPTSEEVPMFLFNSESNDIASRRASTISSLYCFGLTSSSSSDTIQTTRTCSTYGTFGQFRKPQPYNQTTLLPNINKDCVTVDNPVYNYSLQHFREGPSSTMLMDPIILNVRPLSVPIVSPLSPSPSVLSTTSRPFPISSRSHETRSIDYSDFAGDFPSMSALSGVSLSQRDSAISLPNFIVSRSCHDRKASSASANSCLQGSSPSWPATAPAPIPMPSPVDLPRNLAWLKDTIVEILIDQEGFRSITPTFRFAGYSTNTRSLDSSEKALEGGAAQFVPIFRQTFNFHYAPFDGQPVLRRISINGTSRDHVSRQATMCMKSNGVYTVRGTETSIIPSKGAGGDIGSAEAPKLRWKLDYYVDDRKGAGRLQGEKTFTPLTFSCSPLLLHPLQGKKIRLVHVMKKNVVSKLVAEKMEPPKAISSRSPSPLLSETSLLARVDPSKAHLWILHPRRSKSHGFSNGHVRSESSGARVVSPLGTSRVGENHGRHQQPVSQRHRRASSAGDIGVINMNRGYRNIDENGEGLTHDVDPVLVLSPNRLGCSMPRYDRHILPPSELSDLLENIKNTKPALQKVEILTGLSPAPRSSNRGTRALAL